MLSSRQKQNVIKDFQLTKEDTGSAEIQAGILSKQINELIKHLKDHPKDNHSRRGLLKMVGKRKRLLGYLSKKKPKAHGSLVKKLGLKK